MPRPTGVLGEPYQELQALASLDLKAVATSAAILKLALIALEFLNTECCQVDLVSLVPDKKYCAYHVKGTPKLLSRPINAGLWEPDVHKISDWWTKWRAGKKMAVMDLAKVTYTAAMAYCVGVDLFDRNNKKGPASYFEYYIGHLYAVEIGVNPTTAVKFKIGDKEIRLTMDLLFFPPNYSKVHVPVKMSTRERVVQAWSHHRILDAVYGKGQFRGFLYFMIPNLSPVEISALMKCPSDGTSTVQLKLGMDEKSKVTISLQELLQQKCVENKRQPVK